MADYQKDFRMSFSSRFLQLRKQYHLTQNQIAGKVGIHLTQVRRYEAAQAQPSFEALKKIATTFNVTADWLIFGENERELPDEFKFRFEAIKQMSQQEQHSIKEILDAMILKHQAKRLIANE